MAESKMTVEEALAWCKDNRAVLRFHDTGPVKCLDIMIPAGRLVSGHGPVRLDAHVMETVETVPAHDMIVVAVRVVQDGMEAAARQLSAGNN